MGGANSLYSPPTPPGGCLPPASSDLPGLPPVPLRAHTAWRGLWRAGSSLGAQQALCAHVGEANTLCSSSTPPRGPLPPAYPDLPGLPPMPLGPTWPEGGIGGGGYRPGSSAGSLGQSGPGDHPPLLSHSSWRAPPACLSSSPWPQGR